MAEYIDKQAAIAEIKRIYCTDCFSYNGVKCRACDFSCAIDVLEDMPKADVAQVRHGKWLKAINNDCEMHQCDQCGARVVKGLYEYENPNRFCYHCGARMDGGAGNGE